MNDPIEVLCKVADLYPMGTNERNRVWKDDFVLFSLHNKGLIKPKQHTPFGIVYEITEDGWDTVVSARKDYDN